MKNALITENNDYASGRSWAEADLQTSLTGRFFNGMSGEIAIYAEGLATAIKLNNVKEEQLSMLDLAKKDRHGDMFHDGAFDYLIEAVKEHIELEEKARLGNK